MEISYKTSPKNKNDLYGLYKTLGWVDLLDLKLDQLDMAIVNSSYVIYAYEGEKLVGTGRVLSDGALHSYLCGLGILEDYRNMGIGAAITKILADWCDAKGLTPQLNCEESLVPYYKKLGFKEFSIGMKK